MYASFMNIPPSSPTDISVDQLKRDWEQLHPLDRAKAISSLKKSGLSNRQIARQIGRGESTLRHLLLALRAPAADLISARQQNLSTNELVRRAKADAVRRESERHEAAKTQRIEAAQRAADQICSWLAEEHVYGPDGERILDYVRSEYASRTVDGSLPPQVPKEHKLPHQELIRRCSPTEPCPDDAASVDWYRQWLFRWTFYAFPDPNVRDRALDLALERQWKR